MSRRFFSSVAISLILIGMPFLCLAQGTNRPQMPEKPSAKQLAEEQSRRMEKELQLTEKQYKKVFSINLEEQKLRESLMTGGPMGGKPDGSGPGGPGMGGPGMGGPGMGGPGMGGPGMGGPGMGGPGMGGPGMGGPGGQGMDRNGGDAQKMGAPNGGPRMGDIENSSEMQKFQEKKEKKMRKILTPEQYAIWEAQEIRRIMEKPLLMDLPDNLQAR